MKPWDVVTSLVGETEPLNSDAEATTYLYTLHNALLQALREKRWADASEISCESVDYHIRLQNWLKLK